MSRLWAERLLIGLGAQHIELARARRFGRGLAGFKPFDLDRADARSATERLLLGLPKALAAFGAGRGTAAVVLSNDLVRYATLPWQAELGKPAEVQSLARLHFEQVHGEAARDWTVRVHEGGWGRPSLAAAVDSALLTGLAEVLRVRGLRLQSVQPLLMAAFNAVRGELPADAALAVVEPRRLCLGLLALGRPQEVASRRCGTDTAAVAAQELALLGSAAPQRLHVLLVGPQAQWHADGPQEDAPAVQRVGVAYAQQACALAALGAL